MLSSQRSHGGAVARVGLLSLVMLLSALPMLGSAEPVQGTNEPQGSSPYILVLKEPALASYRGGTPGLAKAARLPGSARLDVRGAAATAYVAHLERQQQALETQLTGLLRRSPQVSLRMQHAINALVVELSAGEADAVRALPEVRLLSPMVLHELETDVGPALIGAEPIWDGSNPGASGPAQGEGRVIGVIDSGINFGSPSFAAVGPVDGYVQLNPLGSGNFLGTCVAGGVDAGRCNDKLIGGYDFVCGPPVNACSMADTREEPGFGDTNGHGSHVASTAAGHRRDVAYQGSTVRIAGVAPHASIIAYDACYTEISTGRGFCPSVSTTAAVNQAVADGVVDVINYSIGGGANPWSEPTSLAFLGAVDAGIFVAASAGNAGPGPNTMGHLEPWVSSTAAAQHGRGEWQFTMGVTGPAPVPGALSQIVLVEGTGGVPFSATIPGTTPLRISAGINTASDGCAAYPANTFAGAIAVIRRGTCSFSIKANNASAAGAIAVIFANNAAGMFQLSVSGTTVPVFAVTQADGNALRDFGQANPDTTTATVRFPRVPVSNTADQLAAFSARGPAGEFDLVKPDVTAPGVLVLAATAGTALTGSEQAVDLLSGTSMASPHQAGAALLLRQLRPDWTVPELKSALQMTTTRAVLREDGVTAATPFDMGAGRVRVDRAANAGLLLDETSVAFQLANPATGGDPSTLNLASLGERFCVSQCQFTRRFRNPGAASSSWTASVSGLVGSVSPSNFTVGAGDTVELTITIDSSAIPRDGVHRHGWLELARVGGSTDDGLNLPISVSSPSPVAQLYPRQLAFTVGAGRQRSTTFTLANTGGSPLDFAFDTTGAGRTDLRNTTSTGVATGFRSTVYTDPATAGSQAQFASDDLVVVVPTRVTSIHVEGLVVSGAALTSAATNLTWSIYPDAGGIPAGNPQSNPAAAVWTFTSTPTGPGVTTVGSSAITLDLDAAGQTVNLPPGHYWVVVNTRGTFANRYDWYGSNTQHGNPGFATLTVASNGSGEWVVNSSFPGLTLRVSGDVPCDAPWVLSATPASGSLAGGAQQAVSVELGGVAAAGTYPGAVCFATNDSAVPSIAAWVDLTVASPELVFTTPPSASAGMDMPFAVQPVVTVRDTVTGETATGYAQPVTLELASGAGPLTCNQNPVTPVNGVATFAGCRIGSVGHVTLRARSASALDSTSNPPIAVAAPDLVFTTAPSTTATAGSPLVVQPAVTVRDVASAATVTAFQEAVTLELASGAGPLACDVNPVAPVNGVASFTGCRIESIGNVSLRARSASVPDSTSNPLVTVVAPQLVFTTPPSAIATAGAAFVLQPVVTVRDVSNGATVTGYQLPVTLALASGAGPLTCDQNPVLPVNGVASYSGCRIGTAGTVTLRASSASTTNSTTEPQILVGPGAPAALVFALAPSANATAGVPFAVQPVVHIENAHGSLVTSATSPVTLRVASGEGPLVCDANPVNAVGGIAVFSGCRINSAGNVSLDASTASIASATGQPEIAVTAAAAAQLAFTTLPPASVLVSTPWPVQPAITVQDAFGNTVLDASSPVTLQLVTGEGVLACAANPVVPTAGVASFSGCELDTVGAVTLGASTAGIADSTTQPAMLVSPPYSVGGSVSGLAGSGLVLQNNLGDDLAVAADGDFTFATALASGQPYAVSVLTQPSNPAQTCVVDNGSGTVASADITDITVTCSVSSFTVGGTVSGLAGSGLVLQNDLGDDLAVSADGDFTFATALASGQPYAVSVLTQPSNPAQTCVVDNGSGTVASADITDITVTCSVSSFTVGGSVSGLAGSGLVLQNNLGDDLAVSADGDFTFATALASGQPYAVSVLTQPSNPTQTCVVGNGSGTVASANITDITVTCSVSSFTIGGTVSGLAGSGLVLQNNLGDDLAVSADGDFTFATALASGQPYAVSVLTQPSNPIQTCVVDNGSGTVASADITDVVVDCSRTDLQIAKDSGVAQALDGQVVVYAITVANAGPWAVTGAVLADVLPPQLQEAEWVCLPEESNTDCPAPPFDSGTGNLAAQIDLPVGGFLRYDLSATVQAPAGASVSNTATVVPPAGIVETDPSNNGATSTVLIVPEGIFASGFEAGSGRLTVPAAIKAREAATR